MKRGSIVLQNEKIRLRKYTSADIETIYEKLGCNPEMLRYTGWNPYHSAEAAKEFIDKIIRGYESGTDDYSWVIEAERNTVGTIGAYDFDKEENSIEIGYSIFQEYWGRGYALEAVSLVCSYLMSEEGICRIKAWTAADNTASRKVLEKAGFARTDIKEAEINIKGAGFEKIFYEKR